MVEADRHTWSLVLTSQSGFVVTVVAAPAPEVVIILAPIGSWWFTSVIATDVRHHQYQPKREKSDGVFLTYQYKTRWVIFLFSCTSQKKEGYELIISTKKTF